MQSAVADVYLAQAAAILQKAQAEYAKAQGGGIPGEAVFKTAKVDVSSKEGEMKVLEAVIENNQVYLKFAVPAVDSFTQYNVVVTATYEYR